MSQQHQIELSASLTKKLTIEQFERLQAHAASQCACRHDVALIEKLMIGGKSFDDAMAEVASKSKAADTPPKQGESK